MITKLEKLAMLNKQMDIIVQEVKSINKELEQEYNQTQEAVLKKFMQKMDELACYGKQLTYSGRNYFYPNIDIILDFVSNHYGSDCNLFLEIRADGSYRFTANPSGYSTRPCVYDSSTGVWGFYEVRSKTFFAAYANEILNEVEKGIEKGFERNIQSSVENVTKKKTDLIIKIEQLKTVQI